MFLSAIIKAWKKNTIVSSVQRRSFVNHPSIIWNGVSGKSSIVLIVLAVHKEGGLNRRLHGVTASNYFFILLPPFVILFDSFAFFLGFFMVEHMRPGCDGPVMGIIAMDSQVAVVHEQLYR